MRRRVAYALVAAALALSAFGWGYSAGYDRGAEERLLLDAYGVKK